MSFTDYEKHHLHDYVDKMGSSYNKSEIDNRLAALETKITTLIQSSIRTAVVDIQKAILKFRNNQTRQRVGKKILTIPKTNYTWIKLLDASEIHGVNSLQDVLIQNIYIKRNDRYHHAKSDLVASEFNQLELFYDKDFLAFYCYFESHPSDWSMACFFNYIKIPKQVSFQVFEDSE